jgi:predicted nucleic acid-binding protein
MPSPEKIVINTGPILALVAALGSLDLLRNLYKEVIVPYEIGQEIMAAGSSGFAIKEFTEAAWLTKREQPVWPHPFLSNSLDVGEASVIQLALDEQIGTVCIDEALGRRVARLNVSAQQTPSFFIPPPMLCCAELFQGGAYGAEQAIRQRCKTQLLG